MISQPERPQISVVVPTHDTRDLTSACLASLQRHTQGPTARHEVLVVDDGSRDGTAEHLEANFPQVEVLRHPRATGFSAAANRGLSKARGRLLLVLNSDTEVGEAGLAPLLDAFSAQPELGVVGAGLRNPDGSPQWSGGREPGLVWLFLEASGLGSVLGRTGWLRRIRRLDDGGAPREVDWVTGAAMALRREVWEIAGPLEEGYLFYSQDLEICCKARREGWTVAVAPNFRVIHHGGESIAPGTTTRQDPRKKWLDLLRWARRLRGPEWAERARRWMIRGARLRLAMGAGSPAFAEALSALRDARPPGLAGHTATGRDPR